MKIRKKPNKNISGETEAPENTEISVSEDGNTAKAVNKNKTALQKESKKSAGKENKKTTPAEKVCKSKKSDNPDNKEDGKSETKDRWFSLKLFVLTALAFGAACFLKPSSGIWAMMPFMSLLCLASAFIKITPALKFVNFPIMVFALNSIEHGDIKKSIIYAALCLLNCILFEFSAKRFYKNRRKGILFISLSLVICVCLNVLLIGNPFTAHKAEKEIKEYTAEYYPKQTDGEKSDFFVSPIRFDMKKRCYGVDIYSKKYPADKAAITMNGGYVNDGFKNVYAFDLMEGSRLKITEALRKAFPDAKFTVTQKNIARFPINIGQAENDKTLLEKRMTFEISIGSIQTPEEFKEISKDFIDEIDRAHLDYSELIFTWKAGIFTHYEARVNSRHLDFHAVIDPYLNMNYFPEDYSIFTPILPDKARN